MGNYPVDVGNTRTAEPTDEMLDAGAEVVDESARDYVEGFITAETFARAVYLAMQKARVASSKG